MEEKKKKHKDCECKEGKECSCGSECHCEDECHCHDHECECGHEHCNCNEKTEDELASENELVSTYLNMAQRLQADFDNYRRQTELKLMQTFTRGQSSIIEAFLPCLDTFKKSEAINHRQICPSRGGDD